MLKKCETELRVVAAEVKKSKIIMPESQPLRKVTAYVTRYHAQEKELLVFQHPSAGLQLPAGTVENSETPEDAVVREVAEETGLLDVQIVRKLAVEETFVSPHQRAVRIVCLSNGERGQRINREWVNAWLETDLPAFYFRTVEL